METKMSEIEIRKKIWVELSEFYLDTELQQRDFDGIAETFNNSGLTLQEIKKIDLYEVFPLLQHNLLSVAGEWAGFDPDWLFENCERFYKKRNNWFHQLKCRFLNLWFYWMRKEYWLKIENKIRR